jgi:hypothetical protein
VKKSKIEENEQDEYEKRRSDFMNRLGQSSNKDAMKIIPINTASVWSEIKIIHDKVSEKRHIVMPRSKLVCL